MRLRIPHVGTYFTRIIVPFAALALILVGALSTVFYRSYARTIRGEIVRLSADMLGCNIVHTEFVMRMAIAAATDTYNDIVITTYLNQKTDEPMTESRALRQLSNRRSSYPFIQSIFLYNRNLGSILSAGPASRDGTVPGVAQVRAALSGAMRGNMIVIPQSLSTSPAYQSVNVLSLVFSDQIDPHGFPLNAIVVNVTESSLTEDVSPPSLEQKSAFFVIDDKGEPMVKGQPADSSSARLDLEAMRRISDSTAAASSFTMRQGTVPYLVTYRKGDLFGWTYVHMVPYDTILADSRTVLTSVLAISLASLLMAFILAGALSGFVYRPIGRLLSSLGGGAKPERPEQRLDEIQYIASAYDRLSSQARELSAQNQTHRAMLKEELLRDVLLGDIEPAFVPRRLKDMEIAASAVDCRVLLFRLDAREPVPEQARQDREERLRTALAEAFRGLPLAETVSMGRGEMAVVTGGVDSDAVARAARELQERAPALVSTSVTVAIGDPVESIRRISLSFVSARDLQRYRVAFGPGLLFDSPWLQRTIPEPSVFPVAAGESLVESLRMHKREAFLEEIDGILGMACGFRYPQMLNGLVQLALACAQPMSPVTAGVPLAQRIEPRAVVDAFEAMEDLDGVRAWFTTLFDDYHGAVGALKAARRDRSRRLVRESMEYVEKNFTDPNLSVYLLASRVGLSPNYFSRVFAQTARMRLPEYIAELRFAKAKELLRRTGLSVHEIALKTGYPNINYFYSKFKKATGLTPADYRMASRAEGKRRERG